jgi:putative lipoprotein
MPNAARAWILGAALVAATAVATPAAADSPDPDPWIARDKALHFDASAGIAAGTYAVSAAWLVDARWKALAIGGGVALTAGAGKELLDLAGLGDPSWKDFAWDAMGTAVGLAIAWGVDLLVGGVSSAHPALASPSSPARAPVTPSAHTAALTLAF